MLITEMKQKLHFDQILDQDVKMATFPDPVTKFSST